MSVMGKEGSADGVVSCCFMNNGDHSKALRQDLATVSEHLPRHKLA